MTTLTLFRQKQKNPLLSIFLLIVFFYGFIILLHQVLVTYTSWYPKLIATKLNQSFSDELSIQLHNQCGEPLRSTVLPNGQVFIQCGILPVFKMQTWLTKPTGKSTL